MPAVGREIDIGLAIIGREIRRCRHELWMSQQGLANASGVSQSIISRLENGTLTSLRLIRLAAIVAALAGYGPRAEGMQPSRIRLDLIRRRATS